MSAFVTADVACQQLSFKPLQLAALASKRKIIAKRTMRGWLYDTQEYIARHGLPAEFPMPTKTPPGHLAITRSRLMLAVALGGGLVPMLLWRYGLTFISPPAAAIVTEIQVRPLPLPMPEPEAVKPKPVVAKKPKKQPEQRWFW